MVVLVPVDD